MDEQSITPYLKIVHIVLSKMRNRLPASTDWEELYSAGVMGLIEAAQKFDASRGYTFETFASFRIRGAMQDSLRNLDTLTRTARKKYRQLNDAENTLSQRLGRSPTDNELQVHLGLTPLAFRKLRVDTQTPITFSLNHTPLNQETTWEDSIKDDNAPIAYEILEDKEYLTHLLENIEQLPYRQRKIIHLYYFENQKLHEIAHELGITEARASQLRSEALKLLKTYLCHI